MKKILIGAFIAMCAFAYFGEFEVAEILMIVIPASILAVLGWIIIKQR